MEYTDAAGGLITNSVLDTTGAMPDQLQRDYNLTVYPNPYQDVINIDFFNASASDDISAEIYDLTGRLVLRKDFRSLPAGDNTIRLTDISRVSSSTMNLVALKVNGKVVKTATVLRKKTR